MYVLKIYCCLKTTITESNTMINLLTWSKIQLAIYKLGSTITKRQKISPKYLNSIFLHSLPLFSYFMPYTLIQIIYLTYVNNDTIMHWICLFKITDVCSLFYHLTNYLIQLDCITSSRFFVWHRILFGSFF